MITSMYIQHGRGNLSRQRERERGRGGGGGGGGGGGRERSLLQLNMNVIFALGLAVIGDYWARLLNRGSLSTRKWVVQFNLP